MTKTILITGSTDGIGLLTAQRLAEQGHKVLLHGRSAAKLQDAAATFQDPPATFCADLSALDAVRQLAQDVTAQVEQIDVLINNAGVFKTPSPVLPNGQDVRFVVNALAPHLLTTELLPIIPKNGRIINLSSAAQAPVRLEALQGQIKLADMEAYAQSKRAITVWSAIMAARASDGPIFLSVNPGSLLASKMVKEGFGVAGSDLGIGASILCRLALEPEFGEYSGRYWDNDARGFGDVDLSQADEVVSTIEAMV